LFDPRALTAGDDAFLGFRVDVRLPLRDTRAELSDQIAVLLCDILPLAWIRAQIEQESVAQSALLSQRSFQSWLEHRASIR
jgi:hypothetical protein